MNEEIKNEDNQQDILNQEDLAAQWAEQTTSSQDDSKKDVDQENLAAQWEAEAMAEPSEKSSVEESLPSFDNYEKSENSKLSILMDIPLEVTVEIGSTEIPIEEILKLNPNSIIELDKLISEPVDLKVNGKLIAKGELYTVKNSFGIKITNIITPEDRMKILDEE
ncbi:flagellar motor switch protein FliN [Nitrosophilus labii]|uniref:flagellar motor switch protein FliN n=1 Tax=Nitrosophilus labii TaxID=2706014 RepID=UPI001656A6F3|nr:flagellar motor switch protein FliN [Nitrosophilus labii]